MLEFLKRRFSFADGPNVLGVHVSATNMGDAVSKVIERSCAGGMKCCYVCATGVHGIMEAHGNQGFFNILNRAELNVPDGMPLVWIGRIAGFSEMGRVFGPDFMMRVCQDTASLPIRHYFYGGNEGVAVELGSRLEAKFRGLKIAGTYSPPFRSLSVDEKSEVVNRINNANAHIVWVGLSTPKQERWMAEFAGRLNARVAIGVGAAFDYNTGKIQRAPRWVQRGGLEWAFRLSQEPRRLWRRYFSIIPRFLVLIFAQALLPQRSSEFIEQ